MTREERLVEVADRVVQAIKHLHRIRRVAQAGKVMVPREEFVMLGESVSSLRHHVEQLNRELEGGK